MPEANSPLINCKTSSNNYTNNSSNESNRNYINDSHNNINQRSHIRIIRNLELAAGYHTGSFAVLIQAVDALHIHDLRALGVMVIAEELGKIFEDPPKTDKVNKTMGKDTTKAI